MTLDESQLKRLSAYVTERSKYVIETFGPRPPGSEAEHRAQELVREDLSACCDGEVVIDPFPVAPKAFMSAPRVAGIFMLMSMVAYWFSACAAITLSALAILVIVQEIGRYKLFLDPFFLTRTSYNVLGRQRPRGEMKRRIVLNGHPDAAYEWRYHFLSPRWFPAVVAYCAVALAFKVLIDTGFFFLGDGWAGGYHGIWFAAGLLQFVFAPAGLIAITFTSFKQVAPGANDNLSGTFLATGIAKALRETGVQLENTELAVLITGSEEAGLRGAKAFVRLYPHEFRDVETIVIALDTICDLDHLYVYNRDLNGTVSHDPATCQLLHNAGKACGRELPSGTVFLGSSDATAFTQAGIRAAALCAMDPAPADYYHNRRDNWDRLNPESIEATARILIEAIRQYDENGLPQVP
ncbi:MAG: family peptidase [Candidatus Hydrogenedentes bacterium]|nr:family peptidase [Candidatus Hydrogenedentota bacterium]